jgi:hypothetical protein
METNKELQCPICSSTLEITHQERYEDLSDHVCNPNGTPSLKDGYQCPNENCLAHQLHASWISDGGMYIDSSKLAPGITWTEAHRTIEQLSQSGMYYALNSWEHHYNVGKAAIAARKKTFKLGNYKLKVEPREKGYNYPLELQYLPKKFSYRFEWWKKDGDGYVNIMPTHRMVSYYLREFNVAYKNLMNTDKPKVEDLKKCLGYIDCIHYNYKDDRSFAKISAFLIKTIYPYKVHKVRTLIMPSHE